MEKEKYAKLYEEYLLETYKGGDEETQISYIHEDAVEGAFKFAEWLDKRGRR